MVEMKTKELPLVSVADMQTAQVPQMPMAVEVPMRQFAPEQVPVPSFDAPHGDVRAMQVATPATPFPMRSPSTPPPFDPAIVQHGAPAPQATMAPPVARRPRRWPLAIGSWLGGVVVGMLLLTFGLAFFGGARDVAANTGDPAAAWDTSITLTDAYLTAQAKKNGTAQVQEPTMRVQADGTIAMEGKANLFGRSVPVRGKLQPSIVDGKLKMEIVSMDLGGMQLPEFVVTQIQGSMASAAQPPAAATASTIVNLEASEGKLVIYSKLQ